MQTIIYKISYTFAYTIIRRKLHGIILYFEDFNI